MFFLAQPKASNLELKSPTNMTLSERFANGFKQPRNPKISIWAVNGSQNEVLVVRKINVDYQGFIIGYDIEIHVTGFFIKEARNKKWKIFYCLVW